MLARLRIVVTVLMTVLMLVACSGEAEPPEEPAPTTTSPTPEPEPEPEPPTEEPTEEPAADPLPEGAVNVLLLGTDSRDPQSMTGNADTIMLAHVPADRSRIYLVSFTRDMWVEIPGIGQGKINASFARGGTSTLIDTVAQLVGGLEVDYAIQSNFTGFIALTRWLDGFEVDNKHPTTLTVQSTGRVVEFGEGRITLENTDGLIYVRERKQLPLGDLDRTERQRAALTGMMVELKEKLAEEPEAFPELVAQLYGNVKVTGDLSLEDAIALRPLLEELDHDDVVSLMAPVTGFGTVNGQSVNVVDEPQMAALGEALRNDAMAGYVETYGTGYAP